jgi:hypothetical protein
MKNIHIIPTDKPSRLYSYKSIELYLHSEIVDANSANLNCKNQNIYITSDEEIKEGDWVYRDSGVVFKMTEELLNYYESIKSKDIHKRYKIILTTDQDLINDDVTAIDDNFLEWFVKNPSCESVGVDLIPYDGTKSINKYWGGDYKIIIPKEEPKQEFPQFGTKEFNDLASTYFGGKLSTKLHKGEVVDESYPKEFKQECKDCSESLNDCTCLEDTLDMKQEKMYSEEEVKKLMFDFYYDMSHKMNVPENLISENMTNVDVWFETFKNKK